MKLQTSAAQETLKYLYLTFVPNPRTAAGCCNSVGVRARSASPRCMSARLGAARTVDHSERS